MATGLQILGDVVFRSIDRAWRLLATGLSFALFGLGSLLGGVFVLPLIWLVVREPRRQRRMARAFVGLLLKFFAATMAVLGLLRYQVTGLALRGEERRPGGCMIVANHPSLIDVVFLLALFPQADCVVKSTLWRNPFTVLTVSALGYISNRSPIETLQACIERLQAGASLILFPEGTRSVPGRPLHFRDGAAAIAVRAGCRLLPVLITCRPATLTKGEPWYRIPPRRVSLRFAVQPSFDVRPIVQGAQSKRQATLRLNRYMVDFFEERLARLAAEGDTLGVS